MTTILYPGKRSRHQGFLGTNAILCPQPLALLSHLSVRMRRRATHPRILVDANSRDEREEQLRGLIGPLATTKVACFPGIGGGTASIADWAGNGAAKKFKLQEVT